MAQRIFHLYGGDPTTADLNRWMTGLFPAGLYRGFLANAFTHDMNLHIYHYGGFTYIQTNGAESAITGYYITKEGFKIEEDGNFTFAINPTAGLPRKDILVATHQYVATTGGTAAVYSIIQGTPSSTPVAPALTDPAHQTLLGTLFIPASTSFLDTGPVTYTVPAPPRFNFDQGNYAYIDVQNFFSVRQTIQSMAFGEVAEAEVVAHAIDAGDANCALIITTDGSTLRTIGTLVSGSSSVELRPLFLAIQRGTGSVTLETGGNILLSAWMTTYKLQDGDGAILIPTWEGSAKWRLISVSKGENASTEQDNTFLGTNTFEGSTVLSGATGNKVIQRAMITEGKAIGDDDAVGHILYLNNSGIYNGNFFVTALTDIRYIESIAVGTVIKIQLSAITTLKPNLGSVPGGTKKINFAESDGGTEFFYGNNKSVLTLIEESGAWSVIEHHGVPAWASLSYSSGWGDFYGAGDGFRYTKRDGIVRVAGFISYSGTLGASVTFIKIGTLPFGYKPVLPMNFKVFCQDSVISTLYEAYLYIDDASGDVSLRSSAQYFPTGASPNMVDINGITFAVN